MTYKKSLRCASVYAHKNYRRELIENEKSVNKITLAAKRNGYCYQLFSVANRVNDCYRTFEYGVLGRGNDVRISKVGKSLASNPTSRHQARSSFAMDGNSRLAFFSLAFRRPFLPTWLLSFLVSTPVTYVARKIAAERFARYSVLHARLPRLVPLSSLPVPGYAPGVRVMNLIVR